MRFLREVIEKEFWVGKAKRRRKIMMRLGKGEQVERTKRGGRNEKVA